MTAPAAHSLLMDPLGVFPLGAKVERVEAATVTTAAGGGNKQISKRVIKVSNEEERKREKTRLRCVERKSFHLSFYV